MKIYSSLLVQNKTQAQCDRNWVRHCACICETLNKWCCYALYSGQRLYEFLSRKTCLISHTPCTKSRSISTPRYTGALILSFLFFSVRTKPPTIILLLNIPLTLVLRNLSLVPYLLVNQSSVWFSCGIPHLGLQLATAVINLSCRSTVCFQFTNKNLQVESLVMRLSTQLTEAAVAK